MGGNRTSLGVASHLMASVVSRLALTVALALPASAALPSPASRAVTVKEAKALAFEALTPRQRRLPSIGYEVAPSSRLGRYLNVTVTWQGLSEGSVVVDNFAVDTRTADVWSSTSSCSEKTNGRLRELQRNLRRRLGVSPSEHARLKGHGPLCNG